MRDLSLLLKPASSGCDLRCSYCFYADVSKRRHVKNYGLMSRDTAETVIRRAARYRRVTFCF